MKILLVDDHKLFSSGIKNLLEAGGYTVAGTAFDGNTALAAARELQPDLILMDINMPGCNGVTATHLIKSEFPDIKIVMLTMNTDDDSLFSALKNGASGFLLKNLEAEQLFACLEQIAQGETVFSPEIAGRVLQEYKGKPFDADAKAQTNSLTPRQEAVLAQIARGLPYKDVGLVLDISETTVKYHVREILERLQFDNRAQAIAYFIESRLSR